MTLTLVFLQNPPSTSFFLETVCPGPLLLEDNIHFSLETDAPEEKLKQLTCLNWPFADPQAPTSASRKAILDNKYLNVARPPFERLVHKNIESITYLSLPFHITHLFEQIALNQPPSKQDGSLHIGANVSPLVPDPYRWVHLNPGCLTSVVLLNNDKSQLAFGSRNPFNKMTSSLNRFLKMGSGGDGDDNASTFVSLVDAFPDSTAPPHHILHPQQASTGPSASPLSSRKGSKSGAPLFSRLLDYDSKTYHSRMRAAQTKRLLVSVNVNVINVMALNENSEFAGTKEINSTSSIFPIVDPTSIPASPTSPSKAVSLTNTCKPYKKHIECPLLRLLLHQSLMVTCVLTTDASDTHDPMLILGLNTGDIVAIDLMRLSYRLFDNLGFHSYQNRNTHPTWSNVSVTSLAAINHPKHDYLLFVGYANGEVAILDLGGADTDHLYEKHEVGKENFMTFFKKFDLSPLSLKDKSDCQDESPGYLVGHLKISHKPITSIASTMQMTPCHGSLISKRPMIVAFASDDGLVRFIDLLNTHNKDYGDSDDVYSQPIVSDIISNYFQDGVRHIEFSDDCKYLCMSGKGDLIEIFKMTYYNVSGLLNKNTNASQIRGRSRSGTTNSGSSHLQHAPSSIFLSVNNMAPSTSNEATSDNNESHRESAFYPPMIKDITIVSRLKGHTNTVERVSFILKSDLTKNDPNEENSGGAYNLISCGSDGKVIIWDFDSKAVSRVKKSHFVTSKKLRGGERAHPEQPNIQVATHKSKPVSNSLAPALTVNSRTLHARNRSWSNQDDDGINTSLSNLGINNILSPSPQAPAQLTTDDLEQQKIVVSLYRSLYEVRLKKHYLRLNPVKDGKRKYSCILHGIVDDAKLPSIQIPLLEVDLSYFFKDGKIFGFHVNPDSFWVFGRNGDVFRFLIE